MQNNSMKVHQQHAEPWKITLIDTGAETMTGGRLKRVAHYLDDEEAFCLTYGDGVADIDISKSIAFHRQHGLKASISATFLPGRFGALDIQGSRVATFKEKPKGEGGRINGGYFVLSPQVLSYIDGDETIWEKGPLERLAKEGQLAAYEHDGFWHPMDTLRDKTYLDELWASGKAPWKVWA
jgi:glucose-1-phosphate cytidylyltransferase